MLGESFFCGPTAGKGAFARQIESNHMCLSASWKNVFAMICARNNMDGRYE